MRARTGRRQGRGIALVIVFSTTGLLIVSLRHTGAKTSGAAFTLQLGHRQSNRMPALCIAAATRKSQILLEDSAAQPVASDDIEELLEGDSCVVPDLDQIYERVPEDPAEQLRDLLKGTAVFILPVAGPSVAFSLWQGILQVVHGLLGEEKSLLELTQMTLNPTTNGIVVASLATALGTLTSITVWTLHSR
eukprot:CAMPEP_0179013372 /NCGR_PEP_ID=MMETSP0796-20121207/1691_1 /TAXON_ID=73915 /ORGANISM="Pyrodinium bahamense, Strain pbaha01" /LENGTH=190 /DNA_ID=CAMNT_0020708871 /DNA_START=97 /DNA_END=666 /DNA_ORIENTATION=+